MPIVYVEWSIEEHRALQLDPDVQEARTHLDQAGELRVDYPAHSGLLNP